MIIKKFLELDCSPYDGTGVFIDNSALSYINPSNSSIQPRASKLSVQGVPVDWDYHWFEGFSSSKSVIFDAFFVGESSNDSASDPIKIFKIRVYANFSVWSF